MAAPTQRFRLAIVGAGLIAKGTHLPTALSLDQMIAVTAIVDPVKARAEALAYEYGIRVQIASAVEEVIGKVDGAIIATPNHTHCEIACALLEAGISVFIEKPLATTVDEGRRILDAADRGRCKVALGHYQRFLDAPRLLKKLIAQDYFGEVRHFVHQFGTSGGWPALSSYTLKREAIGGGVLVVTGTHFLDRMLDMWGPPDHVDLSDDSLGGPEAHCIGTVQYVAGRTCPLIGTVRYSKCVALPSGFVMDTERGVVMLRDGFDDRIVLISKDRPDICLHLNGKAEGAFPAELSPYQRMLWDFVTACIDDRAPEVDGAQGQRSMELLQRFYANRRPLDWNWSSTEIAQ